MMEALKQKDSLKDLDITAEHEAIIKGKSKLPRRKRDLVLKRVEYDKQTIITDKSHKKFKADLDKLQKIIKAYREIEKGK